MFINSALAKLRWMLSSKERIYKGFVRDGFFVINVAGTCVEFSSKSCELLKVISAWSEERSEISTRRDYSGIVREALSWGANVLITDEISRFDLMPSRYIACRIDPRTLEKARSFSSAKYSGDVRPVVKPEDAVLEAEVSQARES